MGAPCIDQGRRLVSSSRRLLSRAELNVLKLYVGKQFIIYPEDLILIFKQLVLPLEYGLYCPVLWHSQERYSRR